MTTPPFIVNQLPTTDAVNVGLQQPIRLSVKDDDTYIVASQLRVAVGYSLVHADGTAKYDAVLPGTTRSSFLSGSIDTNDQPTIVIVAGGVQITKTVTSLQQATYFTQVDAGSGFKNVIATAVVTPSISANQPGAIFGIENGPRNTGVYIIFDRPGGAARTRMCGPADHTGTHNPDIMITPAWTGTERYTVIWNELAGMVELYLVVGGTTTLLHEEAISSFGTYDQITGGTPHIGGANAMTMVYGVEGTIGEQVTFGNVAITTDVSFPIFGLAQPGDYATIRRSDESVRYLGGNPLTATVSPWFGPDNKYFASPDTIGTIKAIPNGGVLITKATLGDSLALYREEPGLLSSSTVGFMIEGNVYGTPTTVLSNQVTGMGILVYDGQSVYYVTLLTGTPRTMGLLRKSSPVDKPSSYQIISIDWSNPGTYFRFSADPLRASIDFWGTDLTTPVFTIPFNRSSLPSGADFGFSTMPFIAFGHTSALNTLGSFQLDRLIYQPKYTAFEGRDGVLPDVGATPLWIKV